MERLEQTALARRAAAPNRLHHHASRRVETLRKQPKLPQHIPALLDAKRRLHPHSASTHPLGPTGSSTRLPLHYFDHADHQAERLKPLVDAVKKLKGPNALVELSSGAWALARVTGYDRSSRSVRALVAEDPDDETGATIDSATSASFPRLSVLFAVEPPLRFVSRVHYARAQRDDAEARMLLGFYARAMPTEAVYTLSARQAEHLLDRALPSASASSANAAFCAALVDEVKQHYSLSMNEILLRRTLAQRPQQLRGAVRCELLLAPPDVVPAPAHGTMRLLGVDYAALRASFVARTALAVPAVVAALGGARLECEALAQHSLLDACPADALALADFERLQTGHAAQLVGFLQESWQPAVRRVVLESMRAVGASRLDAVRAAPLSSLPVSPGVGRAAQPAAEPPSEQLADSIRVSLTTQINLMVSDAVTDMVSKSLAAYVDALVVRASSTVCDRNLTADASGEVSSSSLPPPLFAIEVVVDEGDVSAGTPLVEPGTTPSSPPPAPRLAYSTPVADFCDVPVRLVHESLAALESLREMDFWSMHVGTARSERGLRSISFADANRTPAALVDSLDDALRASVGPLTDYLESLRPHEALLARDEEALLELHANGGVVSRDDDHVGDQGSPAPAPSAEEHAAWLAHMSKSLRATLAEKEALADALPSTMRVGMFVVNLASLRERLLTKHASAYARLLELLARRADELAGTIIAGFAEMLERLGSRPTDIEGLVELDSFAEAIPARSEALEAQIGAIAQYYAQLEDFRHDISDEASARRWEAVHAPLRLRIKQEEAERVGAADRTEFQRQMATEQARFEKELEALDARVQSFRELVDPSSVASSAALAAEVRRALAESEERAATFCRRETLFGLPETTYEALAATARDFEPYNLLWSTFAEWKRWHAEWLADPLLTLDPDGVTKSFEGVQKAASRLAKQFKEEPPILAIVEQLQSEAGDFSALVPVVRAMRNPGMRARHWDDLSLVLGKDVRPDEAFTLRTATEELNLHTPKEFERLQRVADRAAKEFAIEKSLDDMQAAWTDAVFGVLPYRATGTSVIKVSDEVNTLLDDHIVLTQQFSFSPYKGPFDKRIVDWDRKLRLVQEVVSEWLACQRNWMYLQPIFDSDDIKRQLPAEGKRFAAVDKRWRKTLALVADSPLILAFCDSDELMEQWVEANGELERIQKNLADYLETKRAAFARFYFLSNDELISILSQTKDPNAVQPHLRKCFEAVHAITMTGDECEMTDMISPEKERVEFLSPLRPKGSVELWMGEIEKMMRLSVRDKVEAGIVAYRSSKRADFVLEHCAMVVLAVTQTYWTLEIEAALAESGVDGVRRHYEKMIGQLKELSALVRTKLSKLQSKTMSALIVMEVHARDVVERLIGGEVAKAADFEWVSQLRYYWEERPTALGDMNMLVRMVQCTFPYGYEYLGASSRLVVTPLTDRCYMTLMGALHIKLGGAPAGPAGTGKTESVKDLAKALAKQCVVFNCSDGLDYKAMGKFFKGLSTAGAWACFDEFNRIDIEVLSVIAQQMLNIQNAIMLERETFDFEGSVIRLDPTTATFITMNPGYAGRTELPDNLKALFRPMAMMVPDYALIAEIRLFSFGFDRPKPLAEKLVSTFRLSSEQLSSQDHYDFGMRAVNTVINTAGLLKKQDAAADEDLQMLRAIRDSNLPKFLRDDIMLFRAIIKDIFPGVAEPSADYPALERELAAVVEKAGLELAHDFVVKCIQLYEMTVVRHGMMLVGPTGGGKSRILRALQAAMSRVRDDPSFEQVRVLQMNPKSITMNQLYGSFDQQTGEWSDGVAAVLIRHMSAPNAEETGVTEEQIKWMVFDGPVDAIWIENMNTVLDDNKKLCLNSGEIIPLAETNRVIFEVEDLAVASPATVSRCGMIYVEPAYLLPSRHAPADATEAPMFRSWFGALPPLLAAQSSKLREMLNALLVPCSELLRLELKQPVACPTPSVFAGVLRILDASLLPLLPRDEDTEPLDADAEAELKARLPKLVEPLVVVALTWAIGGLCDLPSRARFDEHLRDLLKARNYKAAGLPASGSVFDYHFDTAAMKWVGWLSTTAEHAIPETTDFKAAFSSLIVPTASSICYTELLRTLTVANNHVLVVGPTGTAKSVTVSNFLTRGLEPRCDPVMMAFSAQSSANQTQDILDGKMEKRRQGQDKDTGLPYTMWGPVLGKRFVIFVDDFNMPRRETYGAQPPIELLRQMVDNGGWYDRKTLRFKKIVDVSLVSAMGPPGGGRQPMTNRMLRHMHMLSFAEMPDEMIEGIFTKICSSFARARLEGELQDPAVATAVSRATIAVYNATCAALRPTPAKPHYTFNLRDVSKVVQGVLMADKRRVGTKEELARLWVHESVRVFADRMISDEDRVWFSDELRAVVKEHWSLSYDQVVRSVTGKSPQQQQQQMRLPMYCDFYTPNAEPSLYEEIVSVDRLAELCRGHQAEYNDVHLPMGLVLFEDALGHVCRISRVLRQPSGNALLLGVGGSGRQSLTRLAAHIAGYQVFQIEVTKNYGVREWREDLKTVLKLAGYEMKNVVFLFVDTQIAEEIFLENVNNILSGGEVPNLMDDSDLGVIYEKMTPLVAAAGLPANKANLNSMFVRKVKEHMHVVVCMSPLSGDYTSRIRQFPSLINNTTIDWYSAWPPDALKAVASQLLAAEAESYPAETFAGIVDMCGVMHNTVEQKSRAYLDEVRRYNYVTPTSYLELISEIRKLIEARSGYLSERRSRLTLGLDKLQKTKEEVAVLQKQLEEQKPVLIETAAQVKEQQAQIAADQKEAVAIKAEAEEASASAGVKAAECAEIKASAEAGLAEALPALAAAVECLAKLEKSQIVEVKALKKPPAGVRLTLKAVCIMFQIKPAKVADPDNAQKKIDDYWGPSQKMLNDLGPEKFKQALIDFDKDNIPESVIKLVEPICTDADFAPEAIVKVSVACEAMCLWCHAMRKYYYVSREVEPKRQQLAKAEVELKSANAMRAEAEAKLKAVTDRVATLEAQLKEAIDKMASLEEQVERATVQLSNADKLIGGLGGEAKSWEEQVRSLSTQLDSVVGDVLVCAGTISYLGPFTAPYRAAIVGEWLAAMELAKLRVMPECTLSKVLADPVKVRQWNIDGLPADAFSVENGIIMSETKRWPLLIDPQGQANRFLKQSQAKAKLKTIKASDAPKKIQQTLELGIRVGQPVLLENVLETLDPSLDPVLSNLTYTDSSGSLVIKLGDSIIPYSSDFRFALTTVLPNPHYAPEVSVKVTLLNFSITGSGLEDQLLVATVEAERPDLAERKAQLVVQSADNKRKLQELQDEILYMLSHSEGNILDDTKLIETLAQSKITSKQIMVAVAEADAAELEIDETRMKYVPVAVRGSILFFAISDLALVDSMYQYSLAWFKTLFLASIHTAEASDDLPTRIANIIEQTSYSTYANVCRSIFEKHKLMFSFLLAIKIMMGRGAIDTAEWRFLLSGGVLASGGAKPDAAWLEDKVWIELVNLATLPAFAGVDAHVAANLDAWRRLYDAVEPEVEPLPEPYDGTLSPLQKLLVLRCLRPDKVVPAVQLFVEGTLGRRFTEPPPFDLGAAFADSNAAMPLIFVLSPGADPVKGLLAFADTASMADRLDYISLGQGQGPKAERLIRAGKEQGRWVLLMNCHLFVSWMHALEKEVEDIDASKTDPSFRLWLTSMPSPHFPVSVLQNGIKMTNEPPKGLRANLRTALTAMPAERFDATDKPDVWRRVMFGLLLFNAVILERRKFGALGWNIQYEFTSGDLDATLQQAEMLVAQYDKVPYAVIQPLTADINYGGRVTDSWDRRTIAKLLTAFANPSVTDDGYQFSPSGTYRTVTADSREAFLDYVRELPVNAAPEVFGLHENADITCAQSDTYTMFRTLLSLQPRTASSRGKSRDEVLTESARDILARLPELFDLEAIHDAYPTRYEDSMNTVLQQECIRYNRMLRVVFASLRDIIKAVRGEVVMTAELEAVGTSLFNNQVPELWAKVAYPSLKPLATWVPDLISRLGFVQAWIDGGKPTTYWISGFFFPQAFITGTLQNHARKYQLPIDTLAFTYQLRAEAGDEMEAVASAPEDGAYVRGLFLEGARWDAELKLLVESRPKELFTSLPLIHILPVKDRIVPTSGIYHCPVYKTASRFGVLSTTGHSTNFVMTIEVPCDEQRPEVHWVRRGVAGLLALSF